MTSLKYKLDFVQLDVDDWDRMSKFYQDVMGLTPQFLEPEHKYGWLSAGPITLALRGTKKSQPSHNPRVSLQFRVSDINAAITQLESRGFSFIEKQLDGKEGWRIAYFRDPEGNSLAVFTQDSDSESG